MISIGLLCILTVLCIMLSRLASIIILITATAIGFIPLIKNINRNHERGCLMLPTIMFYIL